MTYKNDHYSSFQSGLTWHIKWFIRISWEHIIDLDCHFIMSRFLDFRKFATSDCLWLVEKSRKIQFSTNSQIVAEKVDGGIFLGAFHGIGNITQCELPFGKHFRVISMWPPWFPSQDLSNSGLWYLDLDMLPLPACSRYPWMHTNVRWTVRLLIALFSMRSWLRQLGSDLSDWFDSAAILAQRNRRAGQS
jgi:hypothetical protein